MPSPEVVDLVNLDIEVISRYFLRKINREKNQTTRLGFQVREFTPLPQEIFPILEAPPGSGA